MKDLEQQLIDFLKYIKDVHTDEYDPTIERVVKDYMKPIEEPGKYFADNADMTIIVKRPSKITYTEDEVRELLIKGLTHNDDKLCGSLVTVEKEIRTANFNVWFEENKKK